MKTKEFIKKVKELGFKIIRVGSHIDIMFNNFIVAGVYTDQMHVMTFYSHEKLLLPNVDKLFELLVEYAETPPDEREEEKKFYLKHRWLNLDTDNYLHLDVDDGSCMLNDNEEFSFTKIKLTEKEIKEIKEKFNTDLADFELVEVEE